MCQSLPNCLYVNTHPTGRSGQPDQNLGMDRGEHVILRSRHGCYRLTPVAVDDEPKQDVTAEICQGMKDWKEYLETGKSDKFRPASELIDELRNL